MTEPMVSVIMAAYNSEAFLAQTIESILAQTFTDFEFIILDDCSTDSTPLILAEYAARDSRIVHLTNAQNLRTSRTRNRGQAIAQGRYIAHIDHDDLAHPERLAQQVAFLEAHSTVGLLGTAYTIIDEHNTPLARHHQPLTDARIKWKMLFHAAFSHSSVMCRRSILTHDTTGYDDNFHAAEDYDYWDRLLNFTDGANLPTPLVSWRQSDQQGSVVYQSEQHHHANLVSQRAIHRLLDRDDFITLDEVNMLRYWYHDHKLTRPPTSADFTLAEKALRIRQAFISKRRPAKADEQEITYRLFRGLLPLAFSRQAGASKLLGNMLKLAPAQVMKAWVMNNARRVKKALKR